MSRHCVLLRFAEAIGHEDKDAISRRLASLKSLATGFERIEAGTVFDLDDDGPRVQSATDSPAVRS
jgi:hypothetical protein